jgi:pyridoxal phosphate enzyme (YggS family)
MNPSHDLHRRIADNLAAVRQRIADAARRCGREPDAVRLVAVTKYASLEGVRSLVEAGCHDLGESRPQQLWQRAEALVDAAIRWHLIGHLQRNKVRRTLPVVCLLHSLDSPRLAAAVNEEAELAGRRVAALVEVNISGDARKHGLAPDEVEPLVAQGQRFPFLEIRGLMAMASLEGGPNEARRDFARLRQLRDRVQQSAPEGIELAELSMGMSGDFEQAIEEGATIVRVGSALFEGTGET